MRATNHEASQRSRLSTLAGAVKNTKYAKLVPARHLPKENKIGIRIGRDDADVSATSGHTGLREAAKEICKLIYPFDHRIGGSGTI
jgi:hypothetical protein